MTIMREIMPNKQEDKLNRLKQIINEKSYITSGDFKLASGASSSFFFDMKPTFLDPEGANLLADLVLDRLSDEKNITAIGGLALGACPIASAVCVKSYASGRPITAFYVRKEPKKRGTQKMIEGLLLQPGDRVVIVDDVTTSGGSSLIAVDEVKKLGAEVIKVISIVDRDQGAAENFAKAGVKFEFIFSMHDFE